MDTVDAERIDSVLLDIKALGHYLYFHGRGVSGKPQILCALYEGGGVRTQRELGEMFAIKPSSLSEVLAKMEALGYVVRTRDQGDSRKLIVKLTETGAAEAEAEMARRDRFREWSLSCLTTDEQGRLLELLDRVRDHWKQAEWKELDD